MAIKSVLCIEDDRFIGEMYVRSLRKAGYDVDWMVDGNDGLVAATWIPQEGKPPRKVYHLTEAGKGALVAHRQEWERFAQSVDRILTPGKLKPGANHA